MHGVLILDKTTGISSRRALEPVKRALGRGVRVGHAGTLDPFATGVLVGLLGDATRLSEIAMSLEKSYEATLLFGRETDTLDPDGEVIAKADPGPEPPASLEAALDGFRGEIEQLPPAYSALKVGGRRAYRLAREGIEVPLSPRRVTIRELRLLGVDWPRARLGIVCGAGTYVRALARDVGAALGLPAHVVELRRTAVGPFLARDGLPVGPEARPGAADVSTRLLPPIRIVRAAGLVEVRLGAEASSAFSHGRTVEPPAGATLPDEGRLAVTKPDGETLLGLASAEPSGLLRPVKVLASAAG